MPYYSSLKYMKDKDSAARITNRLIALRNKLDKEVPQKTAGDTLLLATWNIREFDSNNKGYGPRLDESFYYIAEIISAFDIVAIQEVNEDLKPLEKVIRILGPNWSCMVTDVTDGVGGNGERLAYLYDKRKVWFRNVAGEIVLKDSDLIPSGLKATIKLPDGHEVVMTDDAAVQLPGEQPVDLDKDEKFVIPVDKHKITLPEGQELLKKKQFARTPYLVAFQAGWFKFNLCTVHIYFGASSGQKKERRVDEIEAVSKYFKKRRDKGIQRGIRDSFILLGDFNIVEKEDETMEALEEHNFTVPPNLVKSNLKETAFYDQIAYYKDDTNFKLGPGIMQPGDTEKTNNDVFKFDDIVFKETEEDRAIYKDLVNKMLDEQFTQADIDAMDADKQTSLQTKKAFAKDYYEDDWRTFQMSDHYPLWVELKIDFSDEYLANLKAGFATQPADNG